MSMLIDKSSIEVYQSIIKYNPDAIFIINKMGKLIDINQAVTNVFGYTKKDLEGVLYKQIIAPKDIEKMNDCFNNVLNGNPSELYIEAIHKKGYTLNLRTKFVPIIHSGKVIGTYFIVKDNTKLEHELKQTKENLVHSEERLKALFHSAGDAVYILDLEGNVIDINPAFEELYGWRQEEVIGKPLSIIPTHLLKQQEDMMEKTQGGKQLRQIKTVRIKKNGSLVNVNLTLFPIQDSGKRIMGIAGVTRDLSKEERLERSLQESEDRYKRIIELSPDAILIHQNGGIQYANPACVKLLGASSLTELVGQSILNFSPPEYIDMVVHRLEQLTSVGVQVVPTEEKVIRIDGTIVDVEVTGISLQYKGKLGTLMMIRDITSRKKTEEALRESESKYRLIAENMTDLVCEIYWDGTFKYASPSHVTILGYSSDEYEGQVAREWIHPDDRKQVRNSLEKTIETKEGCVFEYRFQNTRGEWVWLEGRGQSIFDDNGEFLHFLVVSREITERKLSEAKLNFMAYHDIITKIPNRRRFKEVFETTLSRSHSYKNKMAVLLMDMDNFKHVNDTYGHDIGDELLRQFAQRVQTCLPKSATFARLGGDEFGIILSGIQNEQEAIQIAEAVLNSLQSAWEIGGISFHTTSSIGLSFYPKHGTTRYELLKHADLALYEVKDKGKNTFKVYSD